MENRQDKETFPQSSFEAELVFEALSIFAVRFSHGFRSTLTTVKGLVDDTLAGYQLEEEDFKLAADAIGRQLEYVDSLKSLTISRSSESEVIMLCEEIGLLAEEFGFSERLGIGELDRVSVKTKHARELRAGIRALCLYLDSKRGKSEERILARVDLICTVDLVMLKLDVCASVIPVLPLGETVTNSWIDLVKADYSVESVHLLFADILLRMTGASSLLQVSDETVTFEIVVRGESE